jgi:hypothetical protein
MRIQTRLLFSIWAILSIQCSKGRTEDQRGLAGKIIAENPGEGDAVVEDMPKPGADAVITNGTDIPPLKVGSEVDVSALPPGFLDDINQINKVSATRTLLYSKANIAWLLDEEKMGVLTKMQSAVTAPSGTRMYVQEGQHFWLFGATSIAFPASKQSEELGQVTLLNITPELMKDPQHKVLFVGPNSIILGADGKASILTREGDKVRSLNLDLPKQSGQTVVVTAAGQGESQDLFWFLTAEQLLLLKRSENNQWNWRVAKFKVDPGVAGTPGQVAMMLAQGEKEVAFMGRTFVLNAGKLYEKDALKLSMPDEKAAAIALDFTTKVAPILKNNCIGCHPGYDTQAVATDKAAAYKTHLMNKTMPPAPNAPLSDADTKIILDWYASIPL